jgi:peptidoglycan/LPS O-acetylase OafA/YrhL
VKKFEGIQVLRGLAAVAVLVTHAKFAGTLGKDAPALLLHHWGGVGVDIFFVISGFVIAGTVESRQPRALEFLLERAVRVVPLYWLASAFMLVVQPERSPSALTTLAFLPLGGGGRWHDPAHPYGWSISLEMWFYLVMATGLLVARRRAAMLCVAALGACVVVAVTAYSGLDYWHWYFPRFAGCPLALEFMAGILLQRWRAHLPPAWLLLPLAAGLFVAGLGQDVFGLHLIILNEPPVALSRTLAWGVPAAFLVAGVARLDRHATVRWPRALVSLGDASYSFYLVQPFAVLFIHAQGWSDWRAVLGAALAVNTVLALALHRAIEKPLTGWLRGCLAAPSRRLAAG